MCQTDRETDRQTWTRHAAHTYAQKTAHVNGSNVQNKQLP